MNKILIALVLAVGLSGNAFAQNTLFLLCENKRLFTLSEIEVFIFNKKTETGQSMFITESGKVKERKYVFTIGDHFYPIYDANTKDKSLENILYILSRKTLKLKFTPNHEKRFKDGDWEEKRRVDPKYCKSVDINEGIKYFQKVKKEREIAHEEALKY